MTPAAESSVHLLKKRLNISSNTSTTGSSIISLLWVCTTVVCVCACVCVCDAFTNDVPSWRWEVKLFRDLHNLTLSSTCHWNTPKSYRSRCFVRNLGLDAPRKNVFFIKYKANEMGMPAELAHHWYQHLSTEKVSFTCGFQLFPHLNRGPD